MNLYCPDHLLRVDGATIGDMEDVGEISSPGDADSFYTVNGSATGDDEASAATVGSLECLRTNSPSRVLGLNRNVGQKPKPTGGLRRRIMARMKSKGIDGIPDASSEQDVAQPEPPPFVMRTASSATVENPISSTQVPTTNNISGSVGKATLSGLHASPDQRRLLRNLVVRTKRDTSRKHEELIDISVEDETGQIAEVGMDGEDDDEAFADELEADDFMLRVFESAKQVDVRPKAKGSSEDPSEEMHGLVGIFADPAAALDDWANDFELDDNNLHSFNNTEVGYGKDLGMARSTNNAHNSMNFGGMGSVFDIEKLLNADLHAKSSNMSTSLGSREISEIVVPLCHRLHDYIQSELHTLTSFLEDCQRCDILRFLDSYSSHCADTSSTEDTPDLLDWKIEYAKLRGDLLLECKEQLRYARSLRDLGCHSPAMNALQQAAESLAARVNDSNDSDINLLAVELCYERGVLSLLQGDHGSDALEYLRLGERTARAVSRSDKRFSWWVYVCKFRVGQTLYSLQQPVEAIQCLCEFGLEVLQSTLFIFKGFVKARVVSADLLRILPISPQHLCEAILLIAKNLLSLGMYELARVICLSAHSLLSSLPYPSLTTALDTLEKKLENSSPSHSRALSTIFDGLDLESEEDWDYEIAQELNIIIERSNPALLPAFVNGSRGSQRSRTLVEDEIRHTVHRLTTQSEVIRKQKLYPKPTEPLYPPGKSLGPEEHERWLRDFVKAPLYDQRAVNFKDGGDPLTMDTDIEMLLVPFNSEKDAVEDYRARLPYLEKFSKDWLLLHLETCWRLQRMSAIDGSTGQPTRQLLHGYFSSMVAFFQNVPVLDDEERGERMKALSYSFEILELTRFLLVNDGLDVRTFEKICADTQVCVVEVTKESPKTLDRTVLELKLRLFMVFVRCHHGKRASLREGEGPFYLLDELDSLRRDLEAELSKFCNPGRFVEKALAEEQRICFLLYVEAIAGFCLTFVGLSPMDCGPLQSGVPRSRHRDLEIFREVSAALDGLFPQIPCRHLCRCKAAVFIAYRLRNEAHDHNQAERFLFDALTCLKKCESVLSPIFPVAIESSNLAQNILSYYGETLFRTGKHRYAIMALQAAMDAQYCREMDRQSIYILANRIATALMARNDWRKSLRLLMAQKMAVHPKDGRRNDFVHFCFTLSALCSNAGCFRASLAPLEACDALLREEELRSFLKQEENQVSDVSLASWLAGKNLWGLMRRLERFLESSAARTKTVVSESDHFQVDFCRAKLFLDSGQLDKADATLRLLLLNDLPSLSESRVLQMVAKSKLRRGEITKCLEYIQEMDRILSSSRDNESEPRPSLHKSFRGLHDTYNNTDVPRTLFLRIRALMVGKRYPEALHLAEDALEKSREGLLRNMAKLSYLRGRIISELLLTDTPFSQSSFSGTSLACLLDGSDLQERPYASVETRGKITAVALDAFGQSSRLYGAISDELHVARSDAYYARTALDWTFRVVAFDMKVEKNGALQYQLSEQCAINVSEVDDLVGSLLRFAQVANIPMFLMESLVSNAEVRFCEKAKSSVWRPWVLDAWVLFSKLFTDGQHFSVLSVRTGSISHLLKLGALLGRMVRLLLFDDEGGMDLIYRHVRVFEAYITLERDLERRLNLSSEDTSDRRAPGDPDEDGGLETTSEDDRSSVTHMAHRETTTGSVLRFISTEGFEFGKSSYQAFLRKPQQQLVAALRGGSYALSHVPIFDLQRLLRGSREEEDIGLESMKVLGDKTNYLGNLIASLSRDVAEEDEFEPGLPSNEKVTSCIHRIKLESRRYSSGEISLEELGSRNAVVFRLWITAIPLAGRQWVLPESIIRHILWILNPPGVLGYYAAEQGKCVRRVSFDVSDHSTDPSGVNCFSDLYSQDGDELRYKLELKYIESLIVATGPPAAREGPGFWRKSRQYPRNLSDAIFHAPRKFLDSNYNPNPNEPEARPVLLICDPALQGIPWEVLLEHTIVRSSTLLDAIRGSQPSARRERSLRPIEMASTKSVTDYISFYSEDSDSLNDIGSARRQLLSFKVLANLRPYPIDRLVKELAMGGFSNPGHLNLVARPTGPLTSALSKTDGLGFRREREVTQRYRHVSFVRVAGLGSATETDLEDAMSNLESHVQVFLCSYADLVETENSIFRLLERKPTGVLLFAPEWALHVVTRFLEDWELARELKLSFMREKSLVNVVKILVREVSKFVREKVIPVVMYLGDDVNRIFPRRIEKSLARVEQRPKINYRDNLSVRAGRKATGHFGGLSFTR